MKPTGKTTWTCVLCPNETKVLHEIVFGRFKQTSTKYNIQVPLCGECHPQKPHRDFHTQLYYKKLFCTMHKLKYEQVKLSLEQRNVIYLEMVRDKCAKNLKKWEK